MLRKNFIEFLGTFFLVLTVGISQNPFAIGGVLAALVYMGGYISGAHYNPAVTLAALLNGKINLKAALQYMVVQLLAGVVAAAAVETINDTAFIPTVAEGAKMSSALLVEVLFTFLLAFVVLHVAYSDKVKNNHYYGAAIGLTLMTAAFIGGPTSGGAFNPAVGLSPYLYKFADLSKNIDAAGFYLIGPMIGGILAGMAYKMTQSIKTTK
ncbi:aquaporin [Candidatus Roizmanbacteria bacterium]|nr:MAG: aquaporin [Candidatus Roizmanbacteria bacterium]